MSWARDVVMDHQVVRNDFGVRVCAATLVTFTSDYVTWSQFSMGVRLCTLLCNVQVCDLKAAGFFTSNAESPPMSSSPYVKTQRKFRCYIDRVTNKSQNSSPRKRALHQVKSPYHTPAPPSPLHHFLHALGRSYHIPMQKAR